MNRRSSRRSSKFKVVLAVFGAASSNPSELDRPRNVRSTAMIFAPVCDPSRSSAPDRDTSPEPGAGKQRLAVGVASPHFRGESPTTIPWSVLGSPPTITSPESGEDAVPRWRDPRLSRRKRRFRKPCCTRSHRRSSGMTARSGAQRRGPSFPTLQLLLRRVRVRQQDRRVVQTSVAQGAHQLRRQCGQCPLPQHVMSRNNRPHGRHKRRRNRHRRNVPLCAVHVCVT